jgi:hypothetical protein
MIEPSAPKNSTTVRSSSGRSSSPPARAPSPTTLRLTRAALQTAFALSDDLGSSLAERLFTSPRRHVRPARERAVLATGRRFELPVVLRSPRWAGARTRLAAWRWGVGPAVLLVHGWEGRGSQLGGFVEPLVAAGLSVVTFDAPGHGDSPGKRLYLTDLADAIADAAALVGPLHATVAHSFGAAGVLLAHARHGVDAPHNVMLAPNVLVADSFERFAQVLALDASERRALEGSVVTSAGLPLAALELTRLAAARDASLLIVHDREDREVSFRQAEQLAAAWPNARLVRTDGLGHRRILRDADVLATVTEQLRQGVPLPASDLVREVDALLARW